MEQVHDDGVVLAPTPKRERFYHGRGGGVKEGIDSGVGWQHVGSMHTRWEHRMLAIEDGRPVTRG